jgi:hypothetical protein
MPKVASTKDGFWDEVFPTASQPSASLGAQVNHFVCLRARSSAAICSSIAYSSANGYLGGIGAAGPLCFVTVGAVKHHILAIGLMEHGSSTSSTPLGTRG